MEGVSQTLHIEICAMDRAPIAVDADAISLPGTVGIFTVLPGHAALVSTLSIGVLTINLPGGEEKVYAVSSGFARVQDDQVVVLTQTAEEGGEIDLARAEVARDKAREALRSLRDTTDVARAEIALKRALARIQAQEKRARISRGPSSTGGEI